LLQLEC